MSHRQIALIFQFIFHKDSHVIIMRCRVDGFVPKDVGGQLLRIPGIVQFRRRRAPEYMRASVAIIKASIRAIPAYDAADLAVAHRFAARMAEPDKKCPAYGSRTGRVRYSTRTSHSFADNGSTRSDPFFVFRTVT